jgi:cell division protease FtsH
MLGGRAAEALTFDEVSTGAADDLARATDLARRMATEFGMSPALGPVRLAGDPQAAYLGPGAWGLDSRVSQDTASQVDAETRRLVEEALDSASALLIAHRATLDRLAERLCDHETVNGSEVTTMLAEAAAAQDTDASRDFNLRHDIVIAGLGGGAKVGPGNGHDPTALSVE